MEYFKGLGSLSTVDFGGAFRLEPEKPAERPNAPGLMSDVRRASGQFVSGVGSTLRDLGAEGVGSEIEQYGAGVVQRNPSEIRSFDDVLSRPFTTAREAVGEVVPQVGLALGSRALGALGGGLIAGPFGATVGGFVGGLLPTAAQTYGGIRTEQREKGIDERGRALAVTVPAALLERFGGAERVALRVAGEGTEFLQRAAGTGFAKNAGKQFVRGGLEEAITEIPQTGLERYGVTGETADLTSAEALDQYGVAGAKAFLGGGSVRAGLSTLAGTRKEPTVTIQPDGTITSDQPVTGAEGEVDLTGGDNVLMTPEQAAQRLQEIQGRRPAPLADTEFEPLPAQRGLFDTRGGEAPPATVAGEQLDLFGGGGQMNVPAVDERQGDLFAPAEPTFQTRITAGLLDSLGLPRQSSMYRQLLGKDMGDPTQQPQIAELFDRVRADANISERTKAGVEGLAMQAFGGLAQQQAMFGPRGGAYPQGIPSTAQAAPGPIENILPTAPLGATQPATPEAAPVAAPVAEAPAAPAPVAAPSIPVGVDLTPEENRAVKQAKAVFDIAETDADRRNVAAIMQRIIDRAAQRGGAPAAEPVTPVGASNAVAAASPAAPVAAGVSSTVTTGEPSGTQASQAKQAEAQRAKAPAAPATVVTEEDDDANAQKTIDELGLRPLVGGAAENLNASVQGGRINVGGRPTFAAKVLTAARDAFLSGKKSRDEQGGKLAQAARAFGDAYAKYLNAAGNMVPSESRTALKSTKKFPQKGEQAQAEARAGENVANVEKLWRDVQTALTALGQAAGNSAKNVEALIRLNKDKIAARKAELDRELGTLGEMQDDTERESNVTIDEEMGARAAEIAAEIKALEKLDLGLSQGWAAAKRGTFRTGKDVLDVRGGEVRTSKEEQQQGFEQPLVRAAKYGYSLNKFTKVETGFQGVLNYIRSSGTPFERMIAKAVSEVFKNTKNPPKVVFAEGKSQFDPKNNTVTMSPTASPEVALHEALHAALQWFVHSNPKDPIVRQLVKSVNQVVKYDTAKLSEKAAEVQKVLADLVAGKRELDAVLELISYGNTLVEFRKALEAMPSKGTPQSFVQAAKDVWNMMLATVRRMLGVNNTAASDVLMGSFRLLQQAAETPQVGKATGRILKAEVTSLDAAAKEVGWADASAFAKGPGAFKTPTQIAFELIGLGRVNGKDLPITSMIKESGAKTAEYIRKNVPTLERMILNFNSKFSNGSLVNDLIERFKFMQNTGYLQMERISQHLMSHPELAKPFLAFMDGNKKALDGVQNGAAFKAIAENLQTLMNQYIDSLPKNSPERRAFQNVKFSQYLLHPDNIGQVAGSTFGVKKLASMLGVERRNETSLDEFKPYLKADADGRIDIDDPLYQLFEDKGGQSIPFGFISIEKFNNGLVPAGVRVATDRVWKMSQYKADAYQFTSNKATVSEAKRALDTEELSAALLNTTAALAHTFASRNFLSGIANIGRNNGEATSGTVAFSNVEELNAAFPDARITKEKLLEVSDESSKSPQIRWRAQRTGVWVKLPESETYGPLAGKIIPGPVWNSMLDMHDRAPLVNIQAFNDVMAFFKKSKTVYNPGTHVTNILSNITLSILHGISPSTMGRSAKMFLDFERNPDSMSKEDLALMKAFYASGAVLGQFSSTEVKKTVYDKLNQAITPDSDSSYITKLKSFSAYERAKAQLAKYDNMASELYAAEDNVFRLAAFLNVAGNIQVRDGSKTLSSEQLEEAGLAGRKLFLDYDIDARAIRALRQSFMPFISWSYAIMPVLGRIAIEKPWAMANVLMTYALMQAALGGGEDEEEKRKVAPEYLRDRAWGGLGPYMHMRLPFLGDDQNPVYFNLGKYIPMFTLFQPPPGESKLAGQEWIPGFATPSGPLTTLLSAMNGYDPFTGKPMHDPTDTQWDKLVNTGKAVYNTMAPAAVNVNFWKNVGDLAAGVTGPTGVEKSSLFLARNLGGLGLYQFNVDESAFYQRKEVKNIKRDFDTAIAKAKRLEYSKGYPDYEALDAELNDLRTRMQEQIAKARGEE